MMEYQKKRHLLIDDTGVHENAKPTQITVFVVACRIMTCILLILGAMALIYGNI